ACQNHVVAQTNAKAPGWALSQINIEMLGFHTFLVLKELGWSKSEMVTESDVLVFILSLRFRRRRRRWTKCNSMPDRGAPISCIAPPIRRDPRSMATSPVLLINSITHCLASDSSPDVKRTVRGLLGEKSCIHDIGMLLIDFTSREPIAISATISL